eukprot:2455467-Amphidinium_carterae.1
MGSASSDGPTTPAPKKLKKDPPPEPGRKLSFTDLLQSGCTTVAGADMCLSQLRGKWGSFS